MHTLFAFTWMLPLGRWPSTGVAVALGTRLVRVGAVAGTAAASTMGTDSAIGISLSGRCSLLRRTKAITSGMRGCCCWPPMLSLCCPFALVVLVGLPCWALLWPWLLLVSSLPTAIAVGSDGALACSTTSRWRADSKSCMVPGLRICVRRGADEAVDLSTSTHGDGTIEVGSVP